jgi:large subunit ribosomal protein L1
MATKNDVQTTKDLKDLARMKEAKKFKNVDNTERGEDGAIIEAPAAKPKAKIEAKVEQKPAKIKGKNITKAKKLVEKSKLTIAEAVKLIKKVKFAKFDESLELHCNLLKTNIKGEVDMPFSTGKKLRVAIVDDALLLSLDEKVVDFDMLVTHPSYMPKLAKYARLLGPRGLMPSPKTGTISENPSELAAKLQGNLLKWKSETKFPILHQVIGKISIKDDELEANVRELLQSIGKQNIKDAYLAATMSPSIAILVD